MENLFDFLKNKEEKQDQIMILENETIDISTIQKK